MVLDLWCLMIGVPLGIGSQGMGLELLSWDSVALEAWDGGLWLLLVLVWRYSHVSGGRVMAGEEYIYNFQVLCLRMNKFE